MSKQRLINILMTKLPVVTLLAVSFGTAHAASITLITSATTIPVAGIVDVEVWMDFTGDPTLGGGSDLFYDASILGFDSWTYAGLGDPGFAYSVDTGTPGAIIGISFGDFAGLPRVAEPSGCLPGSGPCLVGTASFTGLATGTDTLNMADNLGPAGPYISTDFSSVISVDYGTADITVIESVPVPAASWLFASSLGLLGWMRKKTRLCLL